MKYITQKDLPGIPAGVELLAEPSGRYSCTIKTPDPSGARNHNGTPVIKETYCWFDESHMINNPDIFLPQPELSVGDTYYVVEQIVTPKVYQGETLQTQVFADQTQAAAVIQDAQDQATSVIAEPVVDTSQVLTDLTTLS
jgi:hypothetical protein